MSIRCRRRKCRSCQQLYEPDPRSRFHQAYCSEPACRKASKAASQRKWRESDKGRDYFKGPANAQRVKAWRAAHPGYARGRPKRSRALQDDCPTQPLVLPQDKPLLTSGALQDVLTTQNLVLIGIIARLTGSALQDDIALTIQSLLLLGRQIQGPGSPAYGGFQTSSPIGPVAESPPAVQLDRSSPGP